MGVKLHWLETWHTYLKTFKKAQKKVFFLNVTWYFLLKSSYIRVVCWKLTFYFLIRLQTLIPFFLFFSAFCKVQCPFFKNAFALIFIVGIFYFILVWWGLKLIKEKKKSRQLQQICKITKIQINPLMQLRLIFHKAVNKNKLKVWKFQSHNLSSFSAINETVTGVGGVKFVLFFSLFFCL